MLAAADKMRETARMPLQEGMICWTRALSSGREDTMAQQVEHMRKQGHEARCELPLA